MELVVSTEIITPPVGGLFSGGHVSELWAVYIPQAGKMTPLLTEQVHATK